MSFKIGDRVESASTLKGVKLDNSYGGMIEEGEIGVIIDELRPGIFAVQFPSLDNLVIKFSETRLRDAVYENDE